MRPETATSLFEFLSVKLLELEPKESDKDAQRDDSVAPISKTDASVEALSSFKNAESKIELPSQKTSGHRYRDNRRHANLQQNKDNFDHMRESPK